MMGVTLGRRESGWLWWGGGRREEEKGKGGVGVGDGSPLQHSTTQLPAARCSRGGQRVSTRRCAVHQQPPSLHHTSAAALQTSFLLPPDANEPVLASRRPSVSACLSSRTSSRQPAVLLPDNLFFISSQHSFSFALYLRPLHNSTGLNTLV